MQVSPDGGLEGTSCRKTLRAEKETSEFRYLGAL